MAYSRKPRRRPKRRQQRRKRSTFKRRGGRKRMSRGSSRRTILNVSSVKKHDNMLNFVPTSESDPSGGGSPGDIVLPADSAIRYFLFSPTAKGMYPTTADTSTVFNPVSTRQTSDVFARGYREVTTLRLAGPTPYRLRRIVFCCKGLPDILNSTTPGFTPDFYRKVYPVVGATRLMTDLGAVSGYPATITSFLFQGTQNLDWFTPYNAKVNTDYVNVLQDKTYNINPPNQGGKMILVKNWYGFNKRLQYADTEDGSTTIPSEFSSSLSKAGMGDVFILDLYQSMITDSLTSISINNEGCYYWHEK